MININADFKANRTEVTGDDPISLDFVLAIWATILSLSEAKEFTYDEAKRYLIAKVDELQALNEIEGKMNDKT